MTKRNTFILILIAIMLSITVNVVINDIGYILAYVIYCSFLGLCCCLCAFITKRKTHKYMKQLESETQSIINDINNIT